MHGRAPNAIITGQENTMKKEIKYVFSKARHRWCLWHIIKKILEKLGRRIKYESIKNILHGVVYDSLSKGNFMEVWE